MHKRRLIQFALAGLAGLTIPPLAAAAAGQAAVVITATAMPILW